MATTATAAPTFNLTYDQKIPSNFGQDYGQAIASVGQSLASAITQVGGKALEISDQTRTADDTLTQLSQMKDPQGNAILSKEDYDNIMRKGLGAKQQFVGEMFGRFHSQYASMLDQQRQVAVAQATAAAAAPYRMAEIGATGAEQLKQLREQERLRQQNNPDQRLMVPAPAPAPAAGADKIVSPLTMTLNAAKSNPNVLSLLPNLK